MRLLLLALPPLFCSTGCAAYISASGTHLESLHTKDDVHKSLGTPDASGVIDRDTYEDFHTHRKISEAWKAEGFVMVWVGTFGFSDLVFVPWELFQASKQMVKGHDLRFIYDADGVVTAFIVDGEYHKSREYFPPSEPGELGPSKTKMPAVPNDRLFEIPIAPTTNP